MRTLKSSSSMRASGAPPRPRAKPPPPKPLSAAQPVRQFHELVERLLQDVRGPAQGVRRGQGAVGPNLQGQPLEVSLEADAGGLHAVGDLADRREAGPDGDDADDLAAFVLLFRQDVALALLHGHLHGELCVLVGQRGEIDLRVDDLDVAGTLDVRAGDHAGAFDVQMDHPRFRARAVGGGLTGRVVDLNEQVLEVQDQLGAVFFDAANSRELMKYAVNLNGGDGRSGDGRQQDAPQGIAQRGAVAALKRLNDELAVAAALLQYFDMWGRGFNHRVYSDSLNSTHDRNDAPLSRRGVAVGAHGMLHAPTSTAQEGDISC